MGLLIAVVLVTALAPAIIGQSENARAWAMSDRYTDAMAGGENLGENDNTAFASSAAPIFAILPLFWAIVGLAIIAGGVIAATKAF